MTGVHSLHALPPPQAATMVELMERVSARGDVGTRFLGGRGAPREHSYRQVISLAARAATGLSRAGVRPGDCVLLTMADNEAFTWTFLGAIWAGIRPVPVVPPMGPGGLASFLDHASAVIAASGARVLVADGMVRKLIGELYTVAPGLRSVVAAEGLVDAPEASPRSADPSDVCFVQFTSGSTGTPKGIAVTHGNLVANGTAIAHGLGLTTDDVGLAWLPMYHDMGLVGFLVSPMVSQSSVVWLSPLAFLKRPARWLQAMAEHRATVSYAPNFAYGLCARRIKDRELEGVDLSRWRVAGCGAEPIHAETLRRFAQRFAQWGFSPEALLPSYGMAEATLGMTFMERSAGMRVDQVELAALAGESRANRWTADDGGVEIVSCGRPVAGHAVDVVDDRGGTLPERVVGRIRFRGPSVTAGVLQADGSVRPWDLEDGWLDTGDLGYLADGELHVCGRDRELVIIGGRNYHPHDIERCLWDLRGVRTGNTVAFAVPGEETELLVIAVEVPRGVEADPEAVAASVRGAVADSLGLVVHDVVVLPPGSLDKTSSGKLRRVQARARYLSAEGLAGHRRDDGRGLLTALARSQLAFARRGLQRWMRGDGPTPER